MKYLHTMVRVADIEASLRFYRDALGLEVLSRRDNEAGKFTLIFLATPGDSLAQVELTYNWPDAEGAVEAYTGGRNFGHLAYAVPDIYATCRRLVDHGVQISRPPRDGRMAFVRSPDQISVELLQDGPHSLRPSPGSACRMWVGGDGHEAALTGLTLRNPPGLRPTHPAYFADEPFGKVMTTSGRIGKALAAV